MKTQLIYYEDSYLKELKCKVLSVELNGNFLNVILDKTIFYPEGGGQPSDKGMLGTARVEYVRFSNGEIIHQVKGNLQSGEEVHGVLDWDWRYKYMKIHSAGHLLHDVIMSLVKNIIPLGASHGKKAYIEYKGMIDPSQKESIELEVNKIREKDLPIITKFTSYDELAKESKFLPPNLPKDKPLRMLKIGNYPAMADGGVQVKSTGEIGQIWIANITNLAGKSTIRYGVVTQN